MQYLSIDLSVLVMETTCMHSGHMTFMNTLIHAFRQFIQSHTM